MRKIKLTQGYYSIISDIDFELISKYKWYVRIAKNTCYAVTNINKVTVQMHRFIMKPSKKFMIDHINGNGLDNRRINLRICTRSQNLMNSNKPKNAKTSKYKGVSLNKQSKNHKKIWRSEIRLNKKGILIGYFKTEIEAAKAYNKKAKELFGQFAKLNGV